MFLLIKEPGLIFVFRNKEYRTPVEIEFNKKYMEEILIKLRNADIDNFIISKESQSKKIKQQTFNNIIKKDVENTKQNDNNEILQFLKIWTNNIESFIKNNQQQIIIQSHNNPDNIRNDVKEKQENMFIPEIDLSGMELDISENVKIEKNENNQENSADILRKLLGGSE